MATEQEQKLEHIRHSLAHILAAAVQQLYPEAKFGVGPAIEDGFYYDIDFGKATITDSDLPKIEKTMQAIVKANLKFESKELSLAEAEQLFKQKNQPYKLELLKDIQERGTTNLKEAPKAAAPDKVSIYSIGDFEDLCRGGHVESTGRVGVFKLDKLAGAYWRGSEKNKMLTRIYGLAFATQKELDDYIKRQAEAKKRDHRVLGEQLGIFMHSEEVGAGLPLMLPNGESIKHTLMQYMRRKERALDYQYVSTPVLAHEELFQESGHAEFYASDMYSLQDEEGNTFYLKPMSCAHHHKIYQKLVQSYRDLPLRLAEAGEVYRRELSGTLSGLMRVRGPITQNDAHIYVGKEQIEPEFLKVLELFDQVYKELGIKHYWFRLSLPDFSAEKYGGQRQHWQEAGQIIKSTMQKFGAKFVEAEGDAAFYGPKIDVQVRNVLGKEDTIATAQLDILVPERMGLKYADQDGQEATPYVIHRAIFGSYERFMAFLLEQTAGNLPIWLAPEQVRILTINTSEELLNYAGAMHERMKEPGLRSYVDKRNESVNKKIRDAELAKIPYTLVVGEKEVQSGKFVPRVRKDIAVEHQQEPIGLDEFMQTVVNETKSHVRHSSL